MTYFDQVTEAAAFLKSRLGGLDARIGMVLGSGLGAVADAIANPILVPYAEIPHFPQSTVVGHSGRIVAGLLGGVPTVIMQGRVHFYEGYSPQQVTFPMRVLGRLGLRAVVLTNAAGGIAEGCYIGQLVALADHINFMGFNPLVGPNESRFAARPGAGLRFPASGLRFTDMTEAYSKRLRALAGAAAQEEGMSTVPEAIVARHMGLEVLGISCVTNLAAGLGATELSHEEVFEAGRQVEHRLASLFERLVPRMNACLEQES